MSRVGGRAADALGRKCLQSPAQEVLFEGLLGCAEGATGALQTPPPPHCNPLASGALHQAVRKLPVTEWLPTLPSDSE